MDDLALDGALLDASELDLALLDAVLGTAPFDDATLSTDALLTETRITTDASAPDRAHATSTGVRLPHHAWPQRESTSPQCMPLAELLTASAPLPLKPPRKHNRVEILKLRDRVGQLEVELARLRRQRSPSQQHERAQDKRVSPPHAVVATALPRSQWRELALTQYTKLQQAQALNRKLRDAVAKQLQASNVMHSRLQKQHRSCIQDAGIAIERPLTRAESAAVEHDALALALPRLFTSVARQFHEIDVVAHAIGDVSDPHAATNSSRSMSDAVRGVSFEVTTNTPLAGHYAHFAHALWLRITASSSAHASKVAPLPFATSHMKHVAMPIRVSRADNSSSSISCGGGGGHLDLMLTGVLVVRKFEQPHRVVFTIAGAYVLDGSDLLFREEGERQDTSSASSSVPRTRTQPLDGAAKRIQEIVVKSLGEKMRDHLIELQGQLVALSSATALMTLPIANCPIIDAPCC